MWHHCNTKHSHTPTRRNPGHNCGISTQQQRALPLIPRGRIKDNFRQKFHQASKFIFPLAYAPASARLSTPMMIGAAAAAGPKDGYAAGTSVPSQDTRSDDADVDLCERRAYLSCLCRVACAFICLCVCVCVFRLCLRTVVRTQTRERQ